MSAPEVIAAVEGTVGRLTLNRPAAIHALNTGMVAAMTRPLLAWREDPGVTAILIDHAGERGFCAGGDIRFLAESAAEGGAGAREFFFREYQLNHLLTVYGKPVIAVMDGIVMGGGVGISAPATFRVGTERTAYAMPESGIGLFPDVGGGWWLPRLPGESGLWLALAGARLKAADCAALGVTTHTVASADLPVLKAELIANPVSAADILAAHATDPGPAPLSPHRAAIDALFAHDTVEAIFAALAADGSDWAAAQLATLETKSPLTLKTALRQLRAGRHMPSFAAEMAVEMRIAARIVVSHDFSEGVRAVIIEKDNAPRWNPATLEGVTAVMLDAVFAPLPADQEWSPLV